MPYIFAGVDSYKGKPLIGTGTCVDLIKELVPGLKGQSTTTWKAGGNVMEVFKAGKTIPRGTAIATFENGRYPQRCAVGYAGSCHHAAILLSVQAGGVWIMDQYKSDKNRMFIESRFLRLLPPRTEKLSNGNWRDAGNNPRAFYVIEK